VNYQDYHLNVTLLVKLTFNK